MPQAHEKTSTPSTHLIEGEGPEKEGKLKAIAGRLDIFSYVPEPHTFPVSTRKSQIASIVFLTILVSYLTYDFVKFITANQPVVNSYDANVPLNKQYEAPDIAFGFLYGPSLNLTLNDASFFSYQFYTIRNSEGSGNTSVEEKIPLALAYNCNPSWLGVYNSVYQNMTCVNGSMKLMNVPSQNPNSLSQRLMISACQPAPNLTCQSSAELSRMLAGGRFFLIINLPAGFDYVTGTLDQSDYSVEIYQFFLVPGLYGRINIEFYPFQVTTFPTYFTSWRTNNFYYMQSYEPAVHISNVSVYNPLPLAGITLQLYSQLTLVEVQYQTLIKRVSEWGALASLIMAIFGLCCLTYNKSKFLQRNPAWKNFDQAMKQKEDKVVEIEMQNTAHQRGDADSEDEEWDAGAIGNIRKRVEKNMAN